MTFDPNKQKMRYWHSKARKSDRASKSGFGQIRTSRQKIVFSNSHFPNHSSYYFPPKQLPPPVRTTLLSAVPVIPRPPVAPVVRLAPGQVIAPMPPMIPPRINVVPLPPTAPHIMAPRPPPMVVPAGKTEVSKSKQIVDPLSLLNFVMTNLFCLCFSLCPCSPGSTTAQLRSRTAFPPTATSWRRAAQQENEDGGQPHSRGGVSTEK